MFALDPGLAAVSLAPMPFVIWIAFRYGRLNRPATQEVQQRIAELTAEAEENVGGVRVVKAFAQEERQLHRFNRAVARVFDQSMVSTRLRAFYAPADRLRPPARPGRAALRGRPPGHQRVARRRRLRGLLRLRADAHLPDAHARAWRSGWPSARWPPERACSSCSTASRSSPPPAARQPLPAGGGRVELRDVTFGYDGGEPILRNVSLEVEAGKTVALVGPTGSGKTTLVMLVPRLYDVQEGAVLVDGVDVRDVDPALAATRGGRGVRRRLPLLRPAAREHRLRPPRRQR